MRQSNDSMHLFSLLDIPRMLLLILFLILVVFIDLSDPDYFWHLKTGEEIVQRSALLDTDIFSYTFEGEPWVLHEWLFQLLLFLGYDLAGDIGIKVMTALLVIAFVAISYLTVSRIYRKPVLSALLVFVAIAPISSFIAPRPQLFSYLFFAITIMLLTAFKYRQQTRHLYLLPVMMILWVNLHGGYIVGIVLLLFFSACEFISHWQQRRIDAELRGRLNRLALISGITALSSAVNPDFVSHWIYPIQVMSMQAAKTLITEWSSPDFHTISAQFFLLLVIGFFLLYIIRRQRPDTTELLLPVAFITAGFVAFRHMPLSVITALPFAAVALQRGGGEAISESAIGRLYARHIADGKQIGKGEYLLNWLLLLLVCTALWLYAPTVARQHEAERDQIIPVKATAFLIDAGIQGRMFNTYQFGGYLIYRLYPGQKVFIDGRADLYGDPFLLEYMHIYGGESGWDAKFDKYRIDYVVCSRNAPIRQLLMLRGDFRLVYDDAYNSVLLRDLPRFAEVISAYGK